MRSLSKYLPGLIILLLLSCKEEVLVDGRNVNTFDGKVVFTLPNDSLELFPKRPLLTEHGLFVYDRSDGKIKLIDIKQNKIIRSYGGRGRGPGEHEGFWRLDVMGDTLGMVDGNLFRVTLFDVKTSDVIATIPVNRDPDNVFLLRDGFMITALGADSLLNLYSTISDTAISSASVLSLRVRSTYVLSMQGGFTSRNRNSEIIYLPAYDNRVFVFNVKNQKLRRGFHFSTFDTTTFEPSFRKGPQGQGQMFIAPNPETFSVGGVYDNGRLYRFSASHDRAEDKRRYYYIDIYDSNLKYSHSIDMIGERPYPQSVTIHGNRMCFMGLEDLRCYEMNW
jgi:hypothetical protein